MKRLKHYLYWAGMSVILVVSSILAFGFMFGQLLFSGWAPPR